MSFFSIDTVDAHQDSGVVMVSAEEFRQLKVRLMEAYLSVVQSRR